MIRLHPLRHRDPDANDDKIDLAKAVTAARAGQPEAISDIMRAHNQRLFRMARSIVRDDFEAEDIVQEVFIKAFTQAEKLTDPNRLSAWLGKITFNLARDRLRQIKRRGQVIETAENPDIIPISLVSQNDNDIRFSPERQAAMSDVRKFIEIEIDALPVSFREVFMLREVEQMSLRETAETLEIPVATVKSRLHRAKALLRKGLMDNIDAQSLRVFPFGGVRCARSTEYVIEFLQQQKANL